MGIMALISVIYSAYMAFPELSIHAEKKNRKLNWELECERILEKNKDIDRDNETEARNYRKMHDLWQESYSKSRSVLVKKLNETANIRARLYDKGIIYPKYRNITALTSIYEYFQTGRCSDLIGPDGAYNLYEQEFSANVIISQLDTVIKNLEQVKQNQYMLYQQVSSIKSEVGLINEQLSLLNTVSYNILQWSQLCAYYNGLTEFNTAIIAYNSL